MSFLCRHIFFIYDTLMIRHRILGGGAALTLSPSRIATKSVDEEKLGRPVIFQLL